MTASTRIKKIYLENTKQKKPMVVLLILNRIDIETMKILTAHL